MTSASNFLLLSGSDRTAPERKPPLGKLARDVYLPSAESNWPFLLLLLLENEIYYSCNLIDSLCWEAKPWYGFGAW